MERITLHNDKELSEICQYLNRTMDSSSADAVYAEMEEMKNLMQNGYCHFLFKKMNGDIRDAYGTRASDIINAHSVASRQKSVKNNTIFNGTFPYFDIVKNDWRCFRIDALIKIDHDFVI